MPLASPEMRPRQENAEARIEAPKKIEGGVRIVRLDEVAERFAAGQRAEATRAELTERVAREEIGKAQELARRFNNPALASRLLAEAGPKERVAQKAAADREMSTLKAAEAGAVAELVKIEKDQAAMDAWERTREQEAAKLNAELKQNPENKQARARTAEIKVQLDTAMNLGAAKQRLLEWNRAQQQPRVEAPRMAA
ncbi:MAG: hypothetical protein AAB633_01875 [Patescibacteria group bacterium]